MGPNSNPPRDVVWRAPRSYLEAMDVKARGVGAPNYSFADLADRPPTYVSDAFGGMVGRSLWNEYFETNFDAMYNRELRFYFAPLVSGSAQSEALRAKTYGYRVHKVQMRTGNGLWVTWEDPQSSMVVRRGQGFEYYACEQVEFDFPDGSSFRGEFMKIAGYLDVDYSLSRLSRYNPCEHNNMQGTCMVANGAVFCGGEYLDEGYAPDDDDGPTGPPGPPTIEPSPVPTSEPTETGSGADVEWVGNGAYLTAEDVAGELAIGDYYTFAEDYPGVTSTGGDGRYIRRTWSEGGYARSMTFQATPLNQNPTSKAKPRTLSKVTMRDNSDADLEWVTEKGGPHDNVANRNMIVIPRFFDGFFCDSVQFNFWDTVAPPNRYGYANPPLGMFKAKNFTYGNYLGMGGSGPGGSWKLFNPCEELTDKEEYGCMWGEKCRCKIVDTELTCNNIVVPFEAVYDGMGFPATVGARTASAGGVRATSRLVAFASALIAVGAALI